MQGVSPGKKISAQAVREKKNSWVEFVGSLLCSERFFSGSDSGFPSPKKPIFDLISVAFVSVPS